MEMVHKVTFSLYLFLISLASLAQNQDNNDSLIYKLNELQKSRLDYCFKDNRDWVFDKFDSVTFQLFNLQEYCHFTPDTSCYYFLSNNSVPDNKGITLAYAFMNNIVYCHSNDNKLSAYSWDGLGGGSYHSYSGYIQYTGSTSCKTIPFNDFGQKPEVGYYKLEQISENNRTFYLLFGFGTYGSGKQHYNIRIFEIKNDSLIECFACYPNGEDLVIGCNRVQDISLKFDSNKKELYFKKYNFDNEIGFYSDDYIIRRYQFVEGKLIEKGY